MINQCHFHMLIQLGQKEIRRKDTRKILYASHVQLSIYCFPSLLKETQIQRKKEEEFE